MHTCFLLPQQGQPPPAGATSFTAGGGVVPAQAVQQNGPGATHILRLEGAVTIEELGNPEEYTDIMEDMREECAKVRGV